jgi:amidohydrolase
MKSTALASAGMLVLMFACAQSDAAARIDAAKVDALMRSIEPQVIAWRRDIHEHPELSNREVRTSKLVADHLKKLGLEVETGIAHTGVSGWLKGGLPGPTIALRADMDALPVTEKTDVPFKSHATSTYRGEPVGVMHACGHDVHTSVLMGVAQILSQMKASLPGNVLFVFQPAEEGPPDGEEGGARIMLQEGLFAKHKPQAVFGLHEWASLNVGQIGLRSGPFMAASDSYTIEVLGKQAHGSRPWQSVDPIVTSAQIIGGLQTVVSRGVDLTLNPAVVSVGAIKSGIRNNIIPDRAEMIGTIRTFDEAQRADIIAKMTRITENIAAANGAKATLKVQEKGNPVTYNDPKLASKIVPTLQKIVGEKNVVTMAFVTAAEDFSFYAKEVPGLFFMVGSTPADQDATQAPSNKWDYFFVDERSSPIAMRAMTQVALDYLSSASGCAQ